MDCIQLEVCTIGCQVVYTRSSLGEIMDCIQLEVCTIGCQIVYTRSSLGEIMDCIQLEVCTTGCHAGMMRVMPRATVMFLSIWLIS